MVETLTTMFSGHGRRAMAMSKVPTVVTEDNVYQEADDNILPILDDMVETLALPGSGLDGLENLEELLALAESGKSCMLLVEHYSNMDLSIVSLMARKAGGRGEQIGRALVAIAGMKLNEDNPAVAAFAGAYSRIVIYPSRSLHDMGLDEEKYEAEHNRSRAINRAAMKALNEVKTKGKLILVFPSGTRYRSWDPESKKGVREIDSYIRCFDYFCFVALNGQVLHVQKTDMMNDAVTKDLIRVTAGKVMSCADFRKEVRARTPGTEDKKQAVADAIMANLEEMHIAAEEKRLKLLQG